MSGTYEDWPADVQEYLRVSFGEAMSVERLSGVVQERGYCARVRFQNHSVILKKSENERERFVYQHMSLFFRDQGIQIPSVYWIYGQNHIHWLVMEDIPSVWPKSRWKGDREQLQLLFRLHCHTWGKDFDIPDRFNFTWSEDLSDKMTRLLPSKYASRIFQLQKEAEILFLPLCCLSGDPNPTNWGVRRNGDLVLFDWERIGYGSPAIDLAITMPGLGTPDGSLENAIATAYRDLWKNQRIAFPFSTEELQRQIVLAKIWTVFEFLANDNETLEENMMNELYDIIQQ